MKSTAVSLIALIFYNSIFAFSAAAGPQSIIISNTATFNRNNEVIAVQRNELGNVNSQLFPVVKKGSKMYIIQTIDNNNDNAWDELLIEVSLAANATDTLQINWVTKDEQQAYDKLANTHLSIRSAINIPSAEMNEAVRGRGFTQNIATPYYQMEGPGIENDKVAFRSFFDYRNGKDIYGKIIEKPILEKVGVGAGWHTLQPWGMDILKTGNSLGAGGLAVEENNQIYRLGDADSSVYRALYEGALQAAFHLVFMNWDVAKNKQNGSERIVVTKGDFYYRNDIMLALEPDKNLVAGIAHFGTEIPAYIKHNALFASVSTYGKQAGETGANLGLAIMFAADDYLDNKTTDSASRIPHTCYTILKQAAHKKTIYFFACWEKTDSRFSTRRGFEEYLKITAARLAYPIHITYINPA